MSGRIIEKIETDFGDTAKEVDEFQDDYVESRNRKDPATRESLERKNRHSSAKAIEVASDEEFDRQYDLTPLNTKRGAGLKISTATDSRGPSTPSYSIDPWEAVSPLNREMEENETFARLVGVSMR
jgi:hypothetical protein